MSDKLPRGFDPVAVREALEAPHGPDCEPGDEETPGRCTCGKAELAREIAAAAEVEGRYVDDERATR